MRPGLVKFWAERTATPKPNRQPAPPKITLEEQLKALGYELKDHPTFFGWKQLYRDGKIIFDNVKRVHEIYTFTTSSGTVTAFIVETEDFSKGGRGLDNPTISYLIQNDAISLWNSPFGDPSQPILYNDELLWLEVGFQSMESRKPLNVVKSTREVACSFSLHYMAMNPVRRFQATRDHWVLAFDDFVILNGELLNKQLGAQEIFDFEWVHEKPAAFFRKGKRLGVYYGGKITPLEYQDVFVDQDSREPYSGPLFEGNRLYFFGQRDGIWHYVVITLPNQ